VIATFKKKHKKRMKCGTSKQTLNAYIAIPILNHKSFTSSTISRHNDISLLKKLQEI